MGLAGPLLAHLLRRRLLVGFAVTVGGSIGCLHLLKFLIGRARPQVDLRPFFFDAFGNRQLGFDSFPPATRRRPCC